MASKFPFKEGSLEAVAGLAFGTDHRDLDRESATPPGVISPFSAAMARAPSRRSPPQFGAPGPSDEFDPEDSVQDFLRPFPAKTE